ncbi:MAG: sigma factor, partial [Phycisphaerae bacterium]
MEIDARTDQQLITALNRGDLAAFEVLYHRHRDWIVRLAMRFTGNEADALDVLQETWKYVLGKTPHLALTATLTTFLYPAVKNLSIAARRKRQRYIGPADDLAPPALSDLPAPSRPTDPQAQRTELA